MNNQLLILQKEFQRLKNLFTANEFPLAISGTKKLLKKFSNNSILINFLGCCYQQQDKLEEAKLKFITALQFDSNNIPAMNNLANTYKNLKEYDEAEEYYKKIIKRYPNYINAFVNYANMKRQFNDLDGALELLKKATLIDANNRNMIHSLTLVHQASGNFNEAKRNAEKLLKISNNDTEADKILSVDNKYSKEDVHLSNMEEKILNKDLNDKQKFNLHFALSKAYEDIFNYEKAFNHMQLGNKIKRKSLNYKIDSEIKLFKEIKEKFTNLNLKKSVNLNNTKDNLIFIVGMPRSGTTLVHQIISAHKKVYGAGEVDFLHSEIINQFFKQSDDRLKNNLTTKIQNVSLAYSNNLKHYKFDEPYVIDKDPLNFMWIGFIKHIFPNSKIIHCNRNANDVCLSLYKNLFNGLNWSYTEDEIAIFYNLYKDMMSFWHNKLPGFIYDIKYESLVSNQKVEIQKIIDFCGLPIDQNCYDFHNNKTPIKTASVSQARKSVYATSINLSDKYSTKLENLFKQIKKNGP